MKELPQVGFKEAAVNACKKMFQFKGRIRRSEYWWGVLAITIAAFVLSLIPIIGQIAILFVGIAGIAMIFRRLHDTGRSGWWWGCSCCLGIIAGVLFFSSIDFQAYMAAASSSDMSAMMNVITSGLTGGTGIAALLLYIARMVLGLAIFVFTLLDSQPEANKYGDSPKYVVEG